MERGANTDVFTTTQVTSSILSLTASTTPLSNAFASTSHGRALCGVQSG